MSKFPEEVIENCPDCECALCVSCIKVLYAEREKHEKEKSMWNECSKGRIERELALRSENARLRTALEEIQSVVDEQAEDEGLWSIPMDRPQYIAEAHLQQELRKLHHVIEAALEDTCQKPKS